MNDKLDSRSKEVEINSISVSFVNSKLPLFLITCNTKIVLSHVSMTKWPNLSEQKGNILCYSTTVNFSSLRTLKLYTVSISLASISGSDRFVAVSLVVDLIIITYVELNYERRTRLMFKGS